MKEQSGLNISRRTFIQSILILLALMLAAGALTYLLPAGAFERSEIDGRLVIEPGTFQYTQRPDYAAWRWALAPFEVLGGPNGLTVIVVILFLLFVGITFAVMEASGLLAAVLTSVVRRFGQRKYALLPAISLFFMLIGAFFGIFEEVVPLVPITLALSFALGWDSLVGLGMSILAVNLGFSAAITNPFTIGVAQSLAGLPLFSGAWLRVIIFVCTYVVFALFLTRYARRVEQKPESSAVFVEDSANRRRFRSMDFASQNTGRPEMRAALVWFGVSLALILIVLVLVPIIPALGDISMPLVGVLFLTGGIGAALISGAPRRDVGRAMLSGLIGIAPAIPLILMAASIGFIVERGGVMDTLLYRASQPFVGMGPFPAALTIYGLALAMEFFIASGSAKAFLLMPILVPLADLTGLTRQTVVLAYCFGDGFSNLAYPTNPVLLICLGLSMVSYPKWLKWSLGFWFWIILITILFLGVAVLVQYGPF